MFRIFKKPNHYHIGFHGNLSLPSTIRKWESEAGIDMDQLASIACEHTGAWVVRSSPCKVVLSDGSYAYYAKCYDTRCISQEGT